MHLKFIALITTFLILASCTPPPLPTSEVLESVKEQKEESLTRALERKGLTLGSPTFIRIFKQESILEAWLYNPQIKQYRLYRTYPICDFSGELGPKMKEGDYQAPEGFYAITAYQMNPWSNYHLSMDIGFPNKFDRAYGLTGSHLMIHGGCKSQGCYAVTDPSIEEIYIIVHAALQNGALNVPVHIFPFKMETWNIEKFRNDHWIRFWENLKQGYDIFETTKIPPKISVNTRQTYANYVFEEPKLTQTK